MNTNTIRLIGVFISVSWFSSVSFGEELKTDVVTRSIRCDTDKNGRIVSLDAYGITLRELVQIVSIMAHERIDATDCPSVRVSLTCREMFALDLLYRELKQRKYDLVKLGDGSYRVEKVGPKVGAGS